jgi:hypothetical protein
MRIKPRQEPERLDQRRWIIAHAQSSQSERLTGCPVGYSNEPSVIFPRLVLVCIGSVSKGWDLVVHVVTSQFDWRSTRLDCQSDRGCKNDDRVLQQYRLFGIVYIATLVRGSLTIQIFGPVSYTMKPTPNQLFLRQDCSLLSSLSIFHRQFRRTLLHYPWSAPYCQAFLSALLALNWNLLTVRNPLLYFPSPRLPQSDSLHVQIIRQVSNDVLARWIRILKVSEALSS